MAGRHESVLQTAPMPAAPEPFQTIAIIGNTRDARVVESLQVLAVHLHSRGRRVLVDAATSVDYREAKVERLAESELCAQADLLIAVGGDGSMLHAARLAAPRTIPVLGINRGRLGFLADIGPAELTTRVDEILAGRYVSDRRAMLQATLISPGVPDRHCNGLNDVVLQKWQTGRILDFETYIDGRYVNTHGGDGLVIATATGSTAYALSCGGPILYPGLDAVVLAPICPHTLSDRPIVVRSSSVIEVRLLDRPDSNGQVTCDGVSLGALSQGDRLIVEPAAENVTLLHPADHDYYRTLRSKLRWGRGDRTAPYPTSE
ncbi:NAD(+) kinase [Steroidobacter sp. S1-65]|uniref:NAD kinase n=1 Tax=Steroidobacter gossypii TaxID=2805490 RepID=A0ABS1WW48_9GAMM|nr:NAD(+) kinase [Steroidobacter gossypii]MBM0105211.1 NAD(+) kinase [Steroidobacter gossypii]